MHQSHAAIFFVYNIKIQADKFRATVVGEEQEARGMVPHGQDAEQSAPATTSSPPIPPASVQDSTSDPSTLINHHLSPGVQPVAVDATATVADATSDASRVVGNKNSSNSSRPRVGNETLAFHTAVAAGDVSSVQAYISQNADKIHRCRAAAAAAADGVGAALLAMPGPNSSSPSGGSGLSPLELVDLRGRTPLHTACVEGRSEVARVLLRAGADANTFDSAG